MPVVEIVRFPASEAFVEGGRMERVVLERLAQTDGLISMHSGVQVEDGKTGYFFVVWETYAHHKALMEHADYAGIVQNVMLSTMGPLDVQHTEFDGDFTGALAAPATELVVFEAKPGKEGALGEAFGRLAGELSKAPVCRCVVFGESRERKGTYVAALGWDSVEAHWETVGDEGLKGIIGDLYAAAELDIKHTKLVRYSG